ncbi:MAG: hypothetical protein AAB392_01365 [Patescibacteria group bacterium]
MKAQLIGNKYRKSLSREAKRSGGFATLEILIAFLVLILCISAVILLAFGNQSVAIDSETNNEALYKAGQMLEKARSDSRFDFASVNPIPTLPVTFIQDNIYKKSLQVIYPDPSDFFTKKVTSNITWKVDGGRDQTISLSTLLTDPAAVNGGNTCNSVLSGDWTNPQLLGDVDVGQNNGGTDVDIFLQKAYVTTNASATNKPDFYVVDVNNPNLSPLPIIGGVGINTGPGLMAVHVTDKYAYVANQSRNGQLQIIDIQPSTPNLITTFPLTNVTGSGAQALGNSIFYKDGYVYLGLTTTATGPEFNIIDVRVSNAPVLRGSYSIGHDINAIYIRGDYAYIASPHNEELKILNIFDKDNPIPVGFVDLLDNSANGKSIAMVGNTLYLGRTEGASPATKELQLVNITIPGSPAPGVSFDVDSTVNALAIRENLVFMVTSEPGLGFQIWNLDTGLLYGSKNVQQTSTGGMDCEGNYIYIAQRSNKALQIVGPGP